MSIFLPLLSIYQNFGTGPWMGVQTAKALNPDLAYTIPALRLRRLRESLNNRMTGEETEADAE